MKKVLIIDDTKNIRMLLTKCLETEGFMVDFAVDGKEGHEKLVNNSYDLAFLDIKMPEIRGTEVLRRIRDRGITTPIVIITAYATVKNAIDCTNLGAVAYLQKPFSGEKIMAVLQTLIPKLYSDDFESISNIKGEISKIDDLIEKCFFNEALLLLKRIISIEPANPQIHLLFSKAYQGIGDIEIAEKFYRSYLVFRKT